MIIFGRRWKADKIAAQLLKSIQKYVLEAIWSPKPQTLNPKAKPCRKASVPGGPSVPLGQLHLAYNNMTFEAGSRGHIEVRGFYRD